MDKFEITEIKGLTMKSKNDTITCDIILENNNVIHTMPIKSENKRSSKASCLLMGSDGNIYEQDLNTGETRIKYSKEEYRIEVANGNQK